jgi:Cdc6-like AAA superfamily ATPase
MQQAHNMAGKFAGNPAGAASLLQAGSCTELDTLAQTREAAFTHYLSARHQLALCPESGAASHSAALKTFDAARAKLRLSQRNWEHHVAAHHMG